MIFQNPRASLDPVLPVGRQLLRVIEARRRLVGQAAHALVRELLEGVRLPDPARVLAAYPHELSGGMCQRIMIAMALACAPRLLLADEPTTGVDVTIQYEVVRLLRELTERTGMAQVIISHDMGLVAEICDTVAVMYAGRVVEAAPVMALFDAPQHPYTIGLLACRPGLGSAGALRAIPGSVPSLLELLAGCPFAPRCHRAQARCHEEPPALGAGPNGHHVACHFPGADR
jgi:oligopeptide/dipeptide ABC transporter ATP-binding protein